MKTPKIYCLTIISVLLLFSVINVARATPPNYLGVKKGDEFIWRGSINMANINATAVTLFGADNWTYMYNYFTEYYKNETGDDFGLIGAPGIKMVIKNVTDEITGVYTGSLSGVGLLPDLYADNGNGTWQLMLNSSSFPPGSFPFYVINPSSINETTFSYALTSEFVIPIGLNFATIAGWWQTAMTANPIFNGNVTIAAEGYGLKITFMSKFFEWFLNYTGFPFNITGILSDADIHLRWNSQGVFEYGSIIYGGLTIATAQLETSAAIIGYDLIILIGTSTLSIITIIYIYKKKNQ
jgi:hypothetical protein